MILSATQKKNFWEKIKSKFHEVIIDIWNKVLISSHKIPNHKNLWYSKILETILLCPKLKLVLYSSTISNLSSEFHQIDQRRRQTASKLLRKIICSNYTSAKEDFSFFLKIIKKKQKNNNSLMFFKHGRNLRS